MSKALAALLELKDCSDSWCEYYVPIGIHARIDEAIAELLAQPKSMQEDLREDLREEPVAWCQMVEGKVQDLLTSFEMKDWLYDESWIPLYLPPKREPLSDEEIKILYDRHAISITNHRFHFAMESDEYMWGFRDAEKAHGITGITGEDDDN